MGWGGRGAERTLSWGSLNHAAAERREGGGTVRPRARLQKGP